MIGQFKEICDETVTMENSRKISRISSCYSFVTYFYTTNSFFVLSSLSLSLSHPFTIYNVFNLPPKEIYLTIDLYWSQLSFGGSNFSFIIISFIRTHCVKWEFCVCVCVCLCVRERESERRKHPAFSSAQNCVHAPPISNTHSLSLSILPPPSIYCQSVLLG